MELLVAVAQFRSEPGEVRENRRRSLSAIREAAAKGAQVVVLPELCQAGYGITADQAWATAEPLGGETVTAWSGLARDLGIRVVAGLCEQGSAGPYNSAVLIGPEGLEGVYRKTHLFEAEQEAFVPGLELPVFDTSFGRVGILICYDLRFPEAMGSLARRGARLILVPTAWVTLRGRQRDERGYCMQAYCAMALASMNRVYVACADTTGPFRDRQFLAASLIAGPDGWPLAGPAPPGEQVLTAAIVPERAEDKTIAPGNHVFGDRRPSLYAVPGE